MPKIATAGTGTISASIRTAGSVALVIIDGSNDPTETRWRNNETGDEHMWRIINQVGFEAPYVEFLRQEVGPTFTTYSAPRTDEVVIVKED